MKRLFITLLLLQTANFASSAIIYNDINPDDELIADGSGATHFFDFDNDANVDIHVQNWSDAGNFTSAFFAMWSSNAEGITLPGTEDAEVINQGQSIDANGNWNANQFLNIINGNYTAWLNQTEQFLGFRFQQNGDTKYGWVKISVDNADNITVHGWAYENTANTPIAAGDVGNGGTAGIDEASDLLNLSIQPNPTSDNVNINYSTKESVDLTYTITDISGKTVKSGNFKNVAGANTQVIQMGNLESGQYIVSLITVKGTVTRRIMKS